MARYGYPSIISNDFSHLLVVFLITGSLVDATDLCQSKIYCQGELLKTIQMAGIFNDSKSFVDHYQLNDPAVTLANFHNLMTQTGGLPNLEELRKYVDDNFEFNGELVDWTPPDWIESPKILKRIQDPDFRDWVKALNSVWRNLGRKVSPAVITHPERHSLIPLDNGFVIPGGRFRECNYWDSFWVVEGLILSGMTSTAKGMIENFLSLVERFGFVPNGGRIYYLMRSHPPLLIPMVHHYITETGDLQFLVDNLPLLEREFEYFQREKRVNVTKNGITYEMAQYIVHSKGPRPESYREDHEVAQSLPPGSDHGRFYNDIKAGAESGWDFSARWFISANGGLGNNLTEIETSNIVPVDLNAHLQRNARSLASFNHILVNYKKAKYYTEIAAEYQRGIDNVLWNEDEGMWLDYDIKNARSRNYFFPTNLCPLYTKSFDLEKSQIFADKAVAYLKKNNIDKLPGGIPASLTDTSLQWDYPNAWAPLQSFVVLGLRNTGVEPALSLSRQFATRWLRSNYLVYKKTGYMYEKYDARSAGLAGSGGEYEVQTGFGWTNGVIMEFLNTYPDATSNGVLSKLLNGNVILASVIGGALLLGLQKPQ